MKKDSSMFYVGNKLRCISMMAVGCLVLLAGCSSRPATAPVHGKITVGGKPVTAGKITFHPTAGRSSLGTIAADGTYSLTTFSPGDGALVGKHRVTIEATRITGPAAPKSLAEEQHQGITAPALPQVEWIVPQIYSRLETTTLEADVQSGSNTKDFDLQ
jgi:hypothetical protein